MNASGGLDLAGVGRTGHFSQLEPAVQPNDGTEGMQHTHSGAGKEIKNESFTDLFRQISWCRLIAGCSTFPLKMWSSQCNVMTVRERKKKDMSKNVKSKIQHLQSSYSKAFA